jgi:hypothetical protein
MRDATWVSEFVQCAVDHSVRAWSLVIFGVCTLALGLMHEARIAGDVLIVLIRHFKHEVVAGRDVLRRIKRELTTWDSDP